MGRAQDVFELESAPSGDIVSGQAYSIYGYKNVQAVVTLDGGTATIAIDNGIGYSTAEDMVEGASLYNLKDCLFKIVLTGSAAVGVS